MNKKLAKVAIGVLAILLLITGTAWRASAASPKTTKGISISFKDKILTPFSIIKIKGKGFDSAAATSVIFTTSSGHIFTVPALNVSANAVEVSIPPVNYNVDTGLFTGENALFKVIQIKNIGGKFAVKISNEITGLLISSASHPSAYEKLPKGALALSFLAASMESLNAIESKLPKGNEELHMSLMDAQTEIEQLQAAITLFVIDPNTNMEIITEDGTVSLFADDITRLDAIYAGFLGELENRHLVSFKPNSKWSLIPVAHAAEMNECMKQALGEGIGDTALQNILAEPCRYRESAMTETAKAGKILPEAAKFVYTFPFTVSSVMLGAAGLTKAAQIALSSGYSFMTETFIEGKARTSNAAVSIAKAIIDHKLGGPVMEIGMPSAKFFYEVSNVLSNKKAATPAVLSLPNSTPPTVQFIKVDSKGTVAVSGALPISNSTQSAATKEPTPNPTPKPTSKPTPETAPEPTPAPESDRVYSLSINLTATEHAQCDQYCVGHIDDATASTTITFDNLTISPGSAGSEAATVSAPFNFSCKTTASGGRTGSFSDTLDGYTLTISLVDPPSQGITFHYYGGPDYKYFQDTCGGYTSDPSGLIKKAMEKAMWDKDNLAKRVYNINGETVSFSGHDNDAAISNDLSYFDYSGTLIITKVR